MQARQALWCVPLSLLTRRRPLHSLTHSLDCHTQQAPEVMIQGSSREVAKTACTNQHHAPPPPHAEAYGTHPTFLSDSNAADVYSFGILLWSIATGQRPYADIKSVWELPKLVLRCSSEHTVCVHTACGHGGYYTQRVEWVAHSPLEVVPRRLVALQGRHANMPSSRLTVSPAWRLVFVA